MKRETILTFFILVLFAVGASSVMAAKADFSGKWTLDKDKSTGLPPGTTQTMTVKQTGDRLDVDVKISSDRGDLTVKDIYVLDGKETDFAPPLMNGATSKKAKRTSKWSPDENGFDATEEVLVDGPEGEDTLKTTRHWQLSADGKTLTLDITMTGAQGERKSKRIFTKS